VLPAGALVTATGALLFGMGSIVLANLGRFLQGAGGVFALVGAVYIASNSFPSNRAATLVGVTQMFGMAGGSARGVLVAPIISAGVRWESFWVGMALIGAALAVALYLVIPTDAPVDRRDGPIHSTVRSLAVTFQSRQTLLCGLIAGLLFMPTTILDM